MKLELWQDNIGGRNVAPKNRQKRFLFSFGCTASDTYGMLPQKFSDEMTPKVGIASGSGQIFMAACYR